MMLSKRMFVIMYDESITIHRTGFSFIISFHMKRDTLLLYCLKNV